MFLDFLLALRKGGIVVTLEEWLAVMGAIRLGLHGQSLEGFYVLCRSLIIKKETRYDIYDEIFFEFFNFNDEKDFLDELARMAEDKKKLEEVFRGVQRDSGIDPDELDDIIEERRRDLMVADEPAGLERYAEGQQMPFGNGNLSTHGGGGKTRVFDQGVRRFRDWRTDATLDSRQFQMAFRLLRELTRNMDTNEEELDVIGTANATCRQGGILDIVMRPPRRNKLKLMVLIDSGGSMQPHEQLCSLLFQSLNKANTFSDLKIYYFHNYLEDIIYETPRIEEKKSFKIEWILKNLPSEYRVIFLGDAEMRMNELISTTYSSGRYGRADGLIWFKRFKEQYPHSIWLHPQEPGSGWMPDSFSEIGKVFPMFQLSIDGLTDGMKKLMKGDG